MLSIALGIYMLVAGFMNLDNTACDTAFLDDGIGLAMCMMVAGIGITAINVIVIAQMCFCPPEIDPDTQQPKASPLQCLLCLGGSFFIGWCVPSDHLNPLLLLVAASDVAS